jgi:hypothetical protein
MLVGPGIDLETEMAFWIVLIKINKYQRNKINLNGEENDPLFKSDPLLET